MPTWSQVPAPSEHPRTHLATEDAFDAELKGAVTLKRAQGPVAIFRVVLSWRSP